METLTLPKMCPACAADISTNGFNPCKSSILRLLFLSLCITGGESKMVLSSFSLASNNYSNVPPFSFLRKGTKTSAQISKANVIKQ